jgi:hypothetical protein
MSMPLLITRWLQLDSKSALVLLMGRGEGEGEICSVLGYQVAFIIRVSECILPLSSSPNA